MGLLDLNQVEIREPALCQYDKQPCVKEKCNAWITYSRVDGKTFIGCSVLFVPLLLGDVLIELQRNQASSDKVATEVSKGLDDFLMRSLRGRKELSSAE